MEPFIDTDRGELVVPRRRRRDGRYSLEKLRRFGVSVGPCKGEVPRSIGADLEFDAPLLRRTLSIGGRDLPVGDPPLIERLREARNRRVRDLLRRSEGPDWHHRNARLGGRVRLKAGGVRPWIFGRVRPWSALSSLRYEPDVDGCDRLYLVFGERWVEINAFPEARLLTLGAAIGEGSGLGADAVEELDLSRREDRVGLRRAAQAELFHGMAVTGVIVAIIAAAAVIGSWITHRQWKLAGFLEENGRGTEAIVVERDPDERLPTERLRYEFALEKSRFAGEHVVFAGVGPDVGERIPVRYDPADPRRCRWEARPVDYPIAAFALLSLVGLTGLVLAARRELSRSLRRFDRLQE